MGEPTQRAYTLLRNWTLKVFNQFSYSWTPLTNFTRSCSVSYICLYSWTCNNFAIQTYVCTREWRDCTYSIFQQERCTAQAKKYFVCPDLDTHPVTTENEQASSSTSVSLCLSQSASMKVETTLPLQKEARILQLTKDESLASFQWCLLRIAHNYPLLLTNKKLTWQNNQLDCIPH